MPVTPAKYNGVKCMVALSTDKAVKPVNAMGISKAMLEKLVCSQNESDSGQSSAASVTAMSWEAGARSSLCSAIRSGRERR